MKKKAPLQINWLMHNWRQLFLVFILGISLSASADWLTPACSELQHGGGLNACGCHFNRKTGDCHCHQPRGCGCACQPGSCK